MIYIEARHKEGILDIIGLYLNKQSLIALALEIFRTKAK